MKALIKNSKRSRLVFFLAGGVLSLLVGCSTTPTQPAPAWTQQPTRTVDNGYIVYVGKGTASTPEQADFKAEASAIQDVANECTFAPKGTRVEDRYDAPMENGHQAFAKVALTIEDCDKAKNAVDPEQIKQVANVAMAEELKKYQDLEYNPPGSNVAEGTAVNPAVASTQAPPPPPSNEGEYFIQRQQLAYAKEIVIISPPETYPPGSPQTQQFVSQVQPATTQLQNYEAQHPETRSTTQSWSDFERNPSVKIPDSLPQRRDSSGMRSNGWNRPGGPPPGAKSGQQKKRRRHRDNLGP